MLWPFRRRRDPFDPEALMADLTRAWGANRSPEIVAADFKHVFLGSEAGRRVLYQIFAWSHFWHPSFEAGSPDVTNFKEGERNIGLRIMAALRSDPKPLPQRQRQRAPKETT